MKELILIEGLSRDNLFSVIQAVVNDVLLYELETVTSLQVMESDRASQYVVRPNRFCDSWDFNMLCCFFKSELSCTQGYCSQGVVPVA